MNPIGIAAVLAVLCVVALFAVFAWNARRGNRSSNELRSFANVGERTHRETLTKKCDAALARYLLVKFGTDIDHVAVAGAGDQCLGATIDETAAAEDLVSVAMLGTYPGTIRLTANAAITIGSAVYGATGGKVTPLASAAAGAKFVGIALTATAADGDLIEVVTVMHNATAPATLVYEGLHTWAGGVATTDAKTVAGVLSTDRIIATWNLVAGTITAIKAVPTANTITFTTSANQANGDKVAYQVWR